MLLLSAFSWTSCAKRNSGAAIRLGIMPDADSLPFILAKEEGLFKREGVDVELVRFSSATERDAAIQAGLVDGAVSDILAAAFLTAGGFDFVVTSVTDGRYGIASSPQSRITSIKLLKGKTVGISTNTIIHYISETLLANAALPKESYSIEAIPSMPVRLEMLLSGQIDAAGLPEPFLSAALARGASLLASSDEAGLDAAVMVFSKSFLDRHLPDVKKLYHAYDDARQRINEDSEELRAFLVEKAGFPEDARWTYNFVAYRKPGLPEARQVDAVLDWLNSQKLLPREVKSRELLDGRAVAGW